MKKKILLTGTMFLLSLVYLAQLQAQVTIGSQKTPETFSILELISNKTRGLRLPQLNATERNTLTPALASKQEAKGLVIFNTTTNCVNVWNGSQWIDICNALPTLVISPKTMTFTSAAGGGGNQTFSVTTNQQGWIVENQPSWISLTNLGTNAMTVGVPAANAGTTQQSGIIAIATTGGTTILRDTITVIQLPAQTGEQLINTPLPAGNLTALERNQTAMVMFADKNMNSQANEKKHTYNSVLDIDRIKLDELQSGN